MQPIVFECRQVIHESPQSISSNIADLGRWPDFDGYGMLPGIESATYETVSAEMVGARILVKNSDGSTHVEEVLVWEPDSHLVMKLCDFSPPLSRIADHFLEQWTFNPQSPLVTAPTRKTVMVPISAVGRIPLWLISKLFKRAIAHHLTIMAAEAA